MLSCQATLEASNEALVKQARANATNVDLVERVQKVGVLMVCISLLVDNIFSPLLQESKMKEESKEKKEKPKEEDLDVEVTKKKYAAMEEGIFCAASCSCSFGIFVCTLLPFRPEES